MSTRKISINSNYLLFSVLFIILGVLVFTVVHAGLTVNNAYAHSLPVTENPAPDSIIPKGAKLPSELTIDFSERPSPSVSTIQVLNSKNEPVNNGDFKIIGDHDREAMTTLDTKKLADGVYTVSWQTQSLDDGHIARGSYVFGIGNVGPGGAASITAGKTQPTPKIQAVTSNLDGIIKWPLIVSQAAVVGGIFSHLFLWENFGNKIRIKGGLATQYDYEHDETSLHWLRRFSLLLVASSVAILVTGSLLLYLQITELSIHNSIPADWKVFVSQLSGPSGVAWMMRSSTSLIVIASALSYYYITKQNIQKIASSRNEVTKRSDGRKSKRERKKTIKMYLPLYVALVAGSVSILANSITSHNAAVHFLPSLSTSLDWLHFMAVSIWVGGLFYISSILVTTIRSRAAMVATTTTTSSTRSTSNRNIDASSFERTRSIILYYFALLLPRFSLLATISLGVIGVSGLYAAWIQLHSLNALFTTPYGNILIIKLLAALPLVLLGAYHQLRLHRDMVLVAAKGRRVTGGGSSGHDRRDDDSASNRSQVSQTFKNKTNGEDNNNIVDNDSPNDNTNPIKLLPSIPSKFSKTIKIESLIAIAVLLAASLLTITSPPAMNSNMSANGMSTSMSGMSGMSMQPVKNSTYNAQTKIMGVNTKIEINPFYAGFNTFKVTFTNADGKPNTKVYATELTFTNTVANIGPIVANLHKIRPGVFSTTGAYISQSGEWDIAMAAQRQSDFDLNYEFNAKVTSAPIGASKASSGSSSSSTTSTPSTVMPSNMQEVLPKFDSFAWLAIALAVGVIFGSTLYYRRSKKELRKTIEMLEIEHSK